MKAIILVCLIALAAAHSFSSDTKVVQLNDKSFSKVTGIGSGSIVKPTFVLMYAPWCGHCKKLIPDYEKLAEQAGRNTMIAAVDCDANKQTCEKFSVKGYPTLIYFNKDHKMITYTKNRQLEALLGFVNGGHATESVQEVPFSLPAPPPQDAIQMYINLVGGPVPAILAIITVLSSTFVVLNLIF